MSRKGYWHLAKTEAMNVGLSNAYLKKQGLISIRTLWIKVYYPATPDNFREPPDWLCVTEGNPRRGDQHAGWRGGWGRESPGHPIGIIVVEISGVLSTSKIRPYCDYTKRRRAAQ